MNKPFVEIKTPQELCTVLGLAKSQATRFEIRRELVIAIDRKIKIKKSTGDRATKKSGVTAAMAADISNGNVGKISTDELIDVADQLGIKVQIRVA